METITSTSAGALPAPSIPAVSHPTNAMDTPPTKPKRNRDINRGLLGKFMANHHLAAHVLGGAAGDSGSNCSVSTMSNTSRKQSDDNSSASHAHNIRHLVARLAPSNQLDFQDKLQALERQAAAERQAQAISLNTSTSSRRRSSYHRSDGSSSLDYSHNSLHSMDNSSDGSSDSETYIDRHHAKPLTSPSPSVQLAPPKLLEDDACSLADLMSTCSFHSVASSLHDNINRRRLDMAKQLGNGIGHGKNASSLNGSLHMNGPPSLSRQSSSNSVTVSVAVDVADTSMQNSFASLPASTQTPQNGPYIACDEKSGVISDVSLLGFSQSSMMTFSVEELLQPAPPLPVSLPQEEDESQESSLFKSSKGSSTNTSDVEQGKKKWFHKDNKQLRMSRLSEKSDHGNNTEVAADVPNQMNDHSQRSRRSNRSSTHSRRSTYKDEKEEQEEEEPDYVWWGIKCGGIVVIIVALSLAIWLALEYNLFGSDNSPALDNNSKESSTAPIAYDETTDDLLVLGLGLVDTEPNINVDPAEEISSNSVSTNFSAYDNLGQGQHETTNNGGDFPDADDDRVDEANTDTATVAATAAPTTFVPPTRPPSMANDARLPPPNELSTEGLIIWNVLPSYTQITLSTPSPAAQGSEQSRAFAWLQAHPQLLDMPTWRIHQLFGLVSYYYAMQGDLWPAEKKRKWLSYDVPECSWGDAGSPSYLGNACHTNHDATLRGKFRDLNLEKFWGAPSGEGSYEGTRIPPEIALLSDLRSFGIVNCGLTATFGNLIPSQMATMTSLQHVSLRDNHIGGQIPTWLGAIGSLQKLEMGNNHLSGTVPSELGKLTQLQELAMYRNQIRGNLPSELGNMRQLTGLTAIANALTGTLPPHLGNLQNLEWLYLDGNTNMVGTVPSTMCRLPRILSILVDCTVQCGPDPCGSDVCNCYDRR